MLKTNHSFACLGKKKIKKSAKILAVLGDLDELTVSLGLVRVFIRKKKLRREMIVFQKDLIQIGGFLAGLDTKKFPWLRKIKKIEKRIKEIENSKLKRFSLPGENYASVFLHLARVNTRCLERKVVDLNNSRYQSLVDYLNCLSLFLFWLAVEEEKNRRFLS